MVDSAAATVGAAAAGSRASGLVSGGVSIGQSVASNLMRGSIQVDAWIQEEPDTRLLHTKDGAAYYNFLRDSTLFLLLFFIAYSLCYVLLSYAIRKRPHNAASGDRRRRANAPHAPNSAGGDSNADAADARGGQRRRWCGACCSCCSCCAAAPTNAPGNGDAAPHVVTTTKLTVAPAGAALPASASNVAAAVAAAAAAGAMDDEEDELEHERGFLPFVLSTFVFSIALMWIVLVMFTGLIATPDLHLHWTLYWLTKDLVLDYWAHMLFLSSISLFIVAPFAFLYYEAEGFGFRSSSVVTTRTGSHGSGGFSARVFETLVVLTLLTVLIYGSFRLAYSLWSGEEPVLTAFIRTFLSTNLGHHTPGMCIFMVCCHNGLGALIRRAYMLRVPINYRHTLTQNIETYSLQLADLRSRLTDDDHPSYLRPRLPPHEREAKIRQATALTRLQTIAVRQLRSLNTWWCSPIIRNTASIVLVSVSILMTYHIILRVVHREVRLVISTLARLTANFTIAGFGGSATAGAAAASAAAQQPVVAAAAAAAASTANIAQTIDTLLTSAAPTLAAAGAPTTAAAAAAVAVGSSTGTAVLSVMGSDAMQAAAAASTNRSVSTIPSASSVIFGLLLGVNGVSHVRPLFVFVVDWSLIFFFYVATIVGMYSSQLLAPFSPARLFFPDRHTSSFSSGTPPPRTRTTAQFLVVNAAVLLLLSSSLPIVIWVTGLLSFELVEYYPEAELLNRSYLVHVYNLSFLALTAYQIVPIARSIFHSCCGGRSQFSAISGGDPVLDELFAEQQNRRFIRKTPHPPTSASISPSAAAAASAFGDSPPLALASAAGALSPDHAHHSHRHGGTVSASGASLPPPAVLSHRLSSFSMITPPTPSAAASAANAAAIDNRPPALRRLDTFSSYQWPAEHGAHTDADEEQAVEAAKAAGVAITGRHRFQHHHTHHAHGQSHPHGAGGGGGAHAHAQTDDSLHAAVEPGAISEEGMPPPATPPRSPAGGNASAGAPRASSCCCRRSDDADDASVEGRRRSSCGCGCVLGWTLCWFCRLLWWCVRMVGRAVGWLLSALGVGSFVHRHIIDRFVPNFMRHTPVILPAQPQPPPPRPPIALAPASPAAANPRVVANGVSPRVNGVSSAAGASTTVNRRSVTVAPSPARSPTPASTKRD